MRRQHRQIPSEITYDAEQHVSHTSDDTRIDSQTVSVYQVQKKKEKQEKDVIVGDYETDKEKLPLFPIYLRDFHKNSSDRSTIQYNTVQ